MKRLPPAKRNQLIGVVAATVVGLGLVYFLLISPQKEQNASLGVKIHTEQEKLKSIKTSITDNALIATKLSDITTKLNQAEEDVATGDVYAWTYDTIRRFKALYKVEIPSIGQPAVSDMDMLSGFPYRQVKVTISGSAYYHDLGKFVADFENTYPHMRIVNLSIEPSGQLGANAEKLSFRLDIIALVKPNT